MYEGESNSVAEAASFGYGAARTGSAIEPKSSEIDEELNRYQILTENLWDVISSVEDRLRLILTQSGELLPEAKPTPRAQRNSPLCSVLTATNDKMGGAIDALRVMKNRIQL